MAVLEKKALMGSMSGWGLISPLSPKPCETCFRNGATMRRNKRYVCTECLGRLKREKARKRRDAPRIHHNHDCDCT